MLPVLPVALIPTGQEWIWIVAIILLLFGARKLPELARGIGRSIGEFRKAKQEMEEEITNASTDTKKEMAAPAKKES